MFKKVIMCHTILMILFFWASLLNAQEVESQTAFTTPSVFLEEYDGFAFGVYENYWLVIGGRYIADNQIDVLSSFNTNLMVFDWEKDTIFRLPTNGFSISIKEQLSASNLSFLQEGNTLYLVGGYGYRSSVAACSTIPSLMKLEVPKLIDAILNKKDPLPFLQQIDDDRFALRGAKVYKSGNYFFLAGGEKAYVIRAKKDDAFYFVEDCEKQIQSFKLEAVEGTLQVSDFQKMKDLKTLSQALLKLFF